MSGEDFVPVILPAADVLEVAEQAKAQLEKWYAEGKPTEEEEKPATPDETQ